MHEVNWGNFKAKFNGREQDAFERLCYLLFCCEFHRPLGIFRYKNQAGIETEPIEWEGKHVGFQAKFFETSIDQNKEKLKNSIRTAKAKNEDLDRILFYVYQEFSESSVKTKKAPVYKTEIESFATSLSIEIEWRVTSHLEAQLASEENKHIAAYFFNLGKSAVDLVGDLAQHTEAILTPIRSAIAFHGSEIKIDRSQTLDRLKETRTLPLIVVGSAGVGKTAIIKDFYESLKDHIPCYVFKATEFNILHTNNLFASYGPFTVADFLQVHEGDDCKYVVIDSAEALSDIERKEAFQEFLVALMKAKWTVVFTTRHRYFDDLKFQLLNVFSTSFQPLMIPDLSASELIGIAQKHRFTLPPNNRLTTLLQIPFYLGEFLKLYDSIDRKVSYKDFKNILWDQQIARTSYRGNNEHIKRADCFIEIALKRAASGHYFIGGDSFDSAVLNKLETDEIIKYDSGA